MPRKEITVHAPVNPINLDGNLPGALSPAIYALAASDGEPLYLSVKQASEYTGKKKMQITKAVSAGKLNARTREVHPDYPLLTEISKADLDAWNAPKAPKVKVEHAGARATRGGQARRWLLYVPDSQIKDVKEALKPFGVVPTTAYRNKKAKDAAVLTYANAAPNAETQAANAIFQADQSLPMPNTATQVATDVFEMSQDAAITFAAQHGIDLSTPVEHDAAPASTSDELALVEA